jgi:hypothetical protein
VAFLLCGMQITPARDGKPVTIELVDTKTKEPKEVLEVSSWVLSLSKLEQLASCSM